MMEVNYIDGFTFKHYLPELPYMLNDEELEAVWKIMCEEVGAKKLFYDTNCTEFSQFRKMFSHDEDGSFNPIAFAFMDGRLYGVCWLTHVEAKSARLHFFCTRLAANTLNTVNVGRAMMKHWARMKDADGEPLLQSLIGVTPKSYKLVLKYIQKVGFTIIGEAKGGVHLLHEDGYDDAVISTMELKEEY